MQIHEKSTKKNKIFVLQKGRPPNPSQNAGDPKPSPCTAGRSFVKMKEGGGFPQSKLLRYREITTSQTKIWILQRGRPPENMFPPAETVFLLAENMFPLPETALPLPGQQGAATLVRPRTRTQNQKFVRVISVLQRFFVPGPPEVKTPIRLGVGGTKKTKNRSAAKGSHNSANSRKIHEKNEKSDWRKRKPE